MQWKMIERKSSELKEQLLINRGIKTKKDKERFFNPKISDFNKDLKIPGIKKTAQQALTILMAVMFFSINLTNALLPACSPHKIQLRVLSDE